MLKRIQGLPRKPRSSMRIETSDFSPCTWHREPGHSSRRETGPEHWNPIGETGVDRSAIALLWDHQPDAQPLLTWTGASFMSSSLTFSIGFLSAEGVEVVSVFLKPSIEDGAKNQLHTLLSSSGGLAHGR